MRQRSRWLDLAADRRAPWIIIATLCIVAPLHNVYLSGFTGQPGPLWKVWIYELSSGAVVFALSGFVAWSAARFPLRNLSLKIAAAHGLASIVFSAIHVTSMVAIRKVIFGLLGARYEFGPPLRGFAYEYGKDVFTYAFILGIFVISQWVRDSAARRAEAAQFRQHGGITVKTTRGNVFVPFATIAHVESSGNYVTLFTASGQFLHRATMKEVTELLPAEEFARTHRSHLVRLRAICGVRSRPDGEKVLELSDGGRVPLSRTYASAREWTVAFPPSATRASAPRVS
jgi:LytTr DNA-binding domain